jgi:hypothetical protein
VVASLIVGAVFLLAMIIASVRGAVILPADARIPVHAGSVEHCYMAPKKAGLVIWPGAGAVAFGVLGGVGASSLAAGWTAGVRVVLAPAVLGVLLTFQVGALALARRGVSAVGARRDGGEGAMRQGKAELGAAGQRSEGGAGGPEQDGEGERESRGRSGKWL